MVDLGGVRPLAFQLEDGHSYTYAVDGDDITVTPGDADAHTVVRLSYEDWCDFAWELRSCFALLYADRVTIASGSFGHLARWEPALRAIYDGQAVYDFADAPKVLDRDGEPLDLKRTFSLEDPDDELRDFLDRAGYIHLRGVFDAEEVGRLSNDVDSAIARARTDDGRSWWTTVDG